MQKVCRQLGVPDDLVYYFALYLIQREESSGMISILRKLQDYESPYISQKSFASTSATCKLVLRKSSWDPKIDEELMQSKITLNLLYVQTLCDVERGWVQASNETKRQLAQMQSRGAKFEYMEMARQLKDYGYLHFAPCTCDYPMTNTTVNVLVGARELVLRIPGTHDNPAKEGRFKVNNQPKSKK